MSSACERSSKTYALTSADIGYQMQFCIVPATAEDVGANTCASAMSPNVPGLVWYSGASQSGTAKRRTYGNGACVNMSSQNLGSTPASLALVARPNANTTINMHTGSNCSGTKYTRWATAGGVHDINLDSVGIGSNLVSYKITW
jgi:hypothetical protein